jgi:hypothetical protein
VAIVVEDDVAVVSAASASPLRQVLAGFPIVVGIEVVRVPTGVILEELWASFCVSKSEQSRSARRGAFGVVVAASASDVGPIHR